MSGQNDTSNKDSTEQGPVVPEKVERERTTKPVAEKAKTKKAVPPAVEAPVKKKRHRRTRAEMEAARAAEKAAQEALKKPAKKLAPVPAPVTAVKKPAAAPAAKPAAPAVKPAAPAAAKPEWRKGRQWPPQFFSTYIHVQTKKPKALAADLHKLLSTYAEYTPVDPKEKT